MLLSGPVSLRPPPRHPSLDAARGLAVLAMVVVHALLALLSPSVHLQEWLQGPWELQGLTASLFLLVSGWAVVAALDPPPGAPKDTYGQRVRRALLLIFLGYLLRWPGWDTLEALGWSEALVARLTGFDALQCIGVSLLVGATVIALARRSWLRTLALGALAVGIPLAAPAVWRLGSSLPTALQQATGGEGSLLPLFPWAGFFFTGALFSWLLRLLRPGWPQGIALALLGAGVLGATNQLPQNWSPTSAWLVASRVGLGLLVLAAVSLTPARISRLLAPLGRLSIGVYVLHLLGVYGWGGIPGLAERVGPVLGPGPALLAGLGLLGVSYAVARLLWWLHGLTLPWRPGGTTFGPSFSNSQHT